MLVLSRHRDERIILTLPDRRRVVLTVVGIYGDKVRIGIAADVEVTINRSEVQDRIDAEKS